MIAGQRASEALKDWILLRNFLFGAQFIIVWISLALSGLSQSTVNRLFVLTQALMVMLLFGPQIITLPAAVLAGFIVVVIVSGSILLRNRQSELFYNGISAFLIIKTAVQRPLAYLITKLSENRISRLILIGVALLGIVLFLYVTLGLVSNSAAATTNAAGRNFQEWLCLWLYFCWCWWLFDVGPWSLVLAFCIKEQTPQKNRT